MKAVGTGRPIDQLGRVVLPAAIRKELGLRPGDVLSITTEGRRVVMERRREGCAVCDGTTRLRPVNGRAVCAGCMALIVEAAGLESAPPG